MDVPWSTGPWPANEGLSRGPGDREPYYGRSYGRSYDASLASDYNIPKQNDPQQRYNNHRIRVTVESRTNKSSQFVVRLSRHRLTISICVNFELGTNNTIAIRTTLSQAQTYNCDV